MMSRMEALKILFKYTENIPVITSCGNTSREWASLGRRDNHLYMLDTMGLTPSVALGVSLTLADKEYKKCISIEGDGGLLMNPNVLASAAYLNPSKWLLIVFDNECFGSTGGQRSMSTKIDLQKVIEGFNIEVVSVENTESFEAALVASLEKDGPIVIYAKINKENHQAPIINDDPAVLSYKFASFLTQ